jgi:uncharacterized membrane protein YdjX (TVP38/TMEM64 family)
VQRNGRLFDRAAFWLRLFLVMAVIGLLFVVNSQWGADHLSWESLRSYIEDLQEWVQQNTTQAIIIFVIVYIVVTAVSLPVSTGMSITAGALFGLWLGVAIVSFSATVGATLAMWTSRYLFREIVERYFGSRLQLILAGLERDGGWYLLSLRLLTIFPYFLVNLAMGVTRIRTLHYVLATWLGMLPAQLIFVNAGQAVMSIRSPHDVLSLEVVTALALLATAPILLRWLTRRWFRRFLGPDRKLVAQITEETAT